MNQKKVKINNSSNEEDNSASLGEMTLDDIQLNDDTPMEKENNNDSENKTDEEQEVTITLEELKKFKLAKLKSTAEQMGLEGFKNLRKQDLFNLIVENLEE